MPPKTPLASADRLRVDPARRPTPANRFGLEYRAEAERLGPPPVPMIDAHAHINGRRASQLYREVCDLYGIREVWTMSHLEQVPTVKAALGDRVRFIAVPNWMAKDRQHAFQQGYLDDIRAFRDHGARIVKFWVAPRSRDIARDFGEPGALMLDHPWRLKAMELASSLGMFFMAHIADPDTWFQTKYADASVYGTKREQYESLERVVEQFPSPWIVAHMGGWPEDLAFLSGLLERHDNIHLDASATKWMVRELSKHPADELVAFLTRWRGRILFGSDIVTTDQHFESEHEDRGMGHLASTEEEAFDLYASRYWALRTLWETRYDGESNIADPDLAMVQPDMHDEMSAPRLTGKGIPHELLREFYAGSAAALMNRWVSASEASDPAAR